MKHEILICIQDGKVWVQNKPKGVTVRLVSLSKNACIIGWNGLVKEEVYSKNHTVRDLGNIDETNP
jgi:hypothetical protein